MPFQGEASVPQRAPRRSNPQSQAGIYAYDPMNGRAGPSESMLSSHTLIGDHQPIAPHRNQDHHSRELEREERERMREKELKRERARNQGVKQTVSNLNGNGMQATVPTNRNGHHQSFAHNSSHPQNLHQGSLKAGSPPQMSQTHPHMHPSSGAGQVQ